MDSLINEKTGIEFTAQELLCLRAAEFHYVACYKTGQLKPRALEHLSRILQRPVTKFEVGGRDESCLVPGESVYIEPMDQPKDE